MIEGIPKISILVITYNQEGVITKAIESLLSQKDYIYEICVSDDCSKDSTWEILNNYSVKNPRLFKLNKNNPNVGIFENIEHAWSMPTGDIIYFLAGDDEAGKNWFKDVVDFIKSNSIDYKNDLFCIYGDYKLNYSNGDSLVFRNNLCVDIRKLVLYSLIGIVSNRGCCYSRHILTKFQSVAKGRSYIAETAQDIQLPFFSQKVYYLPHVGNIYNAGIGVSVHLDKEQLNDRKQIVPYAFEFLKRNGYHIGMKEKAYCKYNIALKERRSGNGSFMDIKILFWFFLVYCLQIKVFFKSLKHIVFKILRSFLHSNPISMSI